MSESVAQAKMSDVFEIARLLGIITRRYVTDVFTLEKMGKALRFEENAVVHMLVRAEETHACYVAIRNSYATSTQFNAFKNHLESRGYQLDTAFGLNNETVYWVLKVK